MGEQQVINAGAELKTALKANLNIPGFVNALLDKIALPALQASAAKSETKVDDVVVAALGPMLVVELKKLAHEQWENLFANAGEPV